MTTITHIAIGAILAKYGIQSHLLTGDPATIYAAGILFSNLPDIDCFLLKKEKRFYHRVKSIMHMPVIWALGFTGVTYFIKPMFLHSRFPQYLNLTMIATAIHFILDTATVNAGICWLAPVVKKEFSFFTLGEKPISIATVVKTYAKSKLFKAEVVMWAISLYYLFSKPILR